MDNATDFPRGARRQGWSRAAVQRSLGRGKAGGRSGGAAVGVQPSGGSAAAGDLGQASGERSGLLRKASGQVWAALGLWTGGCPPDGV